MSLKAPAPSDLFTLLDEIAYTLREIGLNTERPSDAALASTAPFCFDTLEFHAWLEWVFLPRMQQTIEHERNLAAPCNRMTLAITSGTPRRFSCWYSPGATKAQAW